MSISEQSNLRVTPAARELAERAGIALSMVAGTGPHNQIEVADVEAVLNKKRQTQPLSPVVLPAEGTEPPKMDTAEKAKIQAALEKRRTQALQQATPPENSENASAPSTNTPKVVKLTQRRQTIGSHLQRSIQTVPHSFLEVQVDASGIEGLRRKLEARHENVKPSVTAILIKACAWALQRNPWLNATLDSDRGDRGDESDEGNEVSLWPSVNIGMVVALDEGPVVPVIHHTERLSLREIQEKVDSLSECARNDSLRPDDLADGTFTVSDLGMYGVDRFTAIINPPQVAILTAGRIIKQFVPDAKDRPVLRPTISLILSVDQRAVDSAQAARFLADLRGVLEDPSLLVW